MQEHLIFSINHVLNISNILSRGYMCVHVFSICVYINAYLYTVCLYMMDIIYVYCDMLPFPGTFKGIGHSAVTKTEQNYWPHEIYNFLQKDNERNKYMEVNRTEGNKAGEGDVECER